MLGRICCSRFWRPKRKKGGTIANCVLSLLIKKWGTRRLEIIFYGFSRKKNEKRILTAGTCSHVTCFRQKMKKTSQLSTFEQNWIDWGPHLFSPIDWGLVSRICNTLGTKTPILPWKITHKNNARSSYSREARVERNFRQSFFFFFIFLILLKQIVQ